MHGTRPTTRPVAALRHRGGVIGQRLLAAALPGLADLALERSTSDPTGVPGRRRTRRLSASRLPATSRLILPTT